MGSGEPTIVEAPRFTITSKQMYAVWVFSSYIYIAKDSVDSAKM